MENRECTNCHKKIASGVEICPYCYEEIETASQTVATESNIPADAASTKAEYGTPLIRQNYMAAIAICAILISFAIYVILSKFSHLTVSDFKTEAGVMVLLGSLFTERFVSVVGKYMQNFGMSKSFHTLVLALRIVILSYFGIILLVMILSLAGAYTIAALLIIVGSIGLFAAYVLYIMIGRDIWNLFGDSFVEGSAALGFAMFYGALAAALIYYFIFKSMMIPFILLWLIAPACAIGMFWKARQYSKEFGFREE